MNFEKANSINFNESFKVKGLYPDIQINNLPENIINKIREVYSGCMSEFTSIMQYIYQHFIFYNVKNLENVYRTMEEISIKEMEHYEILAKVLVSCKSDPKSCVYIDNNDKICDYWKASNVNYSKEIIEMFEKDIILEKRAISSYEEIINETSDVNLKQIISRIILDEKSHLSYFEAVIKALKN